MTREALRAGVVTDDVIRTALTVARGDLFIAASYIGCTGRELDSYVRASDELQVFAASIGVLKNNSDYARMSDAQFREQLENLTRSYRIDGLQVIYDLATMPFEAPAHVNPVTGDIDPPGTISAAMAEVKLKAAIQLRGTGVIDSGGNVEHNAVLQELNQLYQASAPRIKTIRAVQIEYDSGPQTGS